MQSGACLRAVLSAGDEKEWVALATYNLSSLFTFLILGIINFLINLIILKQFIVGSHRINGTVIKNDDHIRILHR